VPALRRHETPATVRGVTPEQERRLAENEALFREVNERVQEQAQAHGSDDHVYAYFCECSRRDCTERVHVTSAEYERVRANARRFLVVPEHDVEEIEDVVGEVADAVIVEKQGAAGRRAETLDPRAV